MSLELLTSPPLERLRQALRQQDPTAEAAYVDGRLRVDSVLADEAVLAIARRELGEGEAAEPLAREGCCGGCGGG